MITWVLPFAFVAYLPSKYFIQGGNAFTSIGAESAVAVVFFIIAYAFFTKGTRIYESAGN